MTINSLLTESKSEIIGSVQLTPKEDLLIPIINVTVRNVLAVDYSALTAGRRNGPFTCQDKSSIAEYCQLTLYTSG